MLAPFVLKPGGMPVRVERPELAERLGVDKRGREDALFGVDTGAA